MFKGRRANEFLGDRERVSWPNGLRIEPFAYLRDLFTRITHPHHRLDELLPDQWKLVEQGLAGQKAES